MRLKIFILFISILLIGGCSSSKDAAQRRNLMIPQKDELPRNAKYSGVKQKKTHSSYSKKQKKRKTKSYF